MRLTWKSKYKIFAISMINIKKILASKKYIDSAIKILVKYYENLKVFFRIKMNKLLKYWLYDFKIKLKFRK